MQLYYRILGEDACASKQNALASTTQATIQNTQATVLQHLANHTLWKTDMINKSLQHTVCFYIPLIFKSVESFFFFFYSVNKYINMWVKLIIFVTKLIEYFIKPPGACIITL